MPKKQLYPEKELAALAKQFRMAAGRNRAEAARELDVSRPSLIHAEDFPEKSFIKLRIRMIEKYLNVVGYALGMRVRTGCAIRKLASRRRAQLSCRDLRAYKASS